MAYDSSLTPTELGSGGGGDTFATGGNGGGAIRLIVTDRLMLDGSIQANGWVGSRPSFGGGFGGGAGGSVWITAGTLAGSGSLQAKGGNGYASGGGGGGGRIAVYYRDGSGFLGYSSSTATGGAGGGNGSAGRDGSISFFGSIADEPVTVAIPRTIFFDVQDISGGTVIFVMVGPDDLPVSLRIASNGFPDTGDMGPLTLTSPGLYHLRVYAPLGENPLYQARIWDVPPDRVRTISVSDVVTAVLETPGAVDTWQFDAAANRTVSLDVRSITGAGQLLDFTLRAPDGSTVFATTGSSGRPNAANYGPIMLTQAGTYTLVVKGRGDDAPGYQFAVVGAGLPRITSFSAAGTTPGTIDSLRFHFNQGMDQSSFSLAQDIVSLIGPNGPLAPSGFAWLDPQTLVVNFPAQAATGSYAMTLGPDILDPAAQALDQNRNSVPGEIPGDCFVARVEPTTIGLDQTVLGRIDTSDSLERWSFFGTAGQEVRFDRVAASNPNTVFDLAGPGDWTGFTGLSTGSQAVTLPSSGTYIVTARSIAEQWRGSYSFAIRQTAQTLLDLGVAYQGTLQASGQSQLFRLNLPQGMPLSIRLNDLAAADHNELYAKFGSPPTRDDYDYRFSNAAAANQEISISSAALGTWYVLVYADWVPAAGSFTLLATARDLLLTTTSPAAQRDDVDGVVSITGAGFDQTTRVTLVTASGVSYAADAVQVDAFTRLTATFHAGTVPQGVYSVRVSRADGASAERTDAFQVIEGGRAQLETHLILPQALGWHGLATIYVEYTNAGDVAMPAPLLGLTVESGGREGAILTLDASRLAQGFWTADMPQGFSTSIQILASGATPGLLGPGETMRVPVYWAGFLMPWFGPGFDFYTSVTTAEDTGVIDWNAFQETLRPDSVPADAWPSMWSNFVDAAPGTWGDYVRLLDKDAAYLGRLGQRVIDPTELLRFEFSQANGLSLFDSLDTEQDVSVAVPGTSLTFTRAYLGTSIADRYADGPLGRGWVDNWQWLLEKSPDGTINVNAPDGTRYAFKPGISLAPDMPTVYRSQSGDGFRLTSYPMYVGVKEVQRNGVTSYVAEYMDTLVFGDTDGTLRAFAKDDGRFLYVEDRLGNRFQAEYTAGRVTQWSYVPVMKSLVDAPSRPAYQPTQYIRLAYNDAGRIQSVTDPVGRQTVFAYDSTGEHLISARYYDGRVSQYSYLPADGSATAHALTEINFPGGVSRYFSYDPRGRLLETHSNDGADAVTFAYDSAGTLSVADAQGQSARYYFNQWDAVVKVEDAMGRSVTTEVSSDGSTVRTVDNLGRAYVTQYDSPGKVSITDPNGGQTKLEWETTPVSRGGPGWTHYTLAQYSVLASVHDPNGNWTKFDTHWNSWNLSPTVEYSAGYSDGTVEYVGVNEGPSDFSWDVVSSTNRRGQTVRYSYDADGRLLSEVYPDGSQTSFTYDVRGNLTTATDARGTTAFTYDANDYLTQVEYPGGRFLAYTYDAAGRRASMTDQLGHRTNYDYDAVGRLERLTDENGQLIIQYAYNVVSQLAREDKGNGTYSTYEYDAAGDLLHLVNCAPDGTVQSRFDYTYDLTGQRVGMATIDGQWTYEYDAIGQLIHAVFESTNSAISDQDLIYQYDAAGNRVLTEANGQAVTYVTNNMNQYVTVGTATYQYDQDGNLISKTDGGQSWTYRYNVDNRLVEFTGPDGTWQYEYDPLGNRSATIYNGQRTEYVLDPSGLGNVVGEYNATGLVAQYSYGLGLASRTAAIGQPTYYAFDAIGSTSELTTGSGAIVNSYTYDPFGNLAGHSGDTSNPFAFVGRYGVMDDGSGLDFMRARFYDPGTGKFISSDPAGLSGGDYNEYRYAFNSPAELVDPSGLATRCEESWYNWLKRKKDEIWDDLDQEWHGWQDWANWVRSHYFTENLNALHNWFAPKIPDLIGLPPGAISAASQTLGNGTLKPQLFPGQSYIMEQALKPSLDFSTRTLDSISNTLDPQRHRDISDLGSGGRQPGGAGGEGARCARSNGGEAESCGDGAHVDHVGSVDPNEKTGPSGYGEAHYVRQDQVMPYRIDFENDAAATAPAQFVTITDQLNANLDPNTFELTEIGFGDQFIVVPSGMQHYTTTVSMTASSGQQIVVEIAAGIQPATGQVYATFSTIDPNTQLPPEVLTGFLPPEDSTGRGQGHISYLVKPKAGVATGTEIRNVANITFDFAETIATNQIDPHDPSKGTDAAKECLNTIDAGAPTSSVAALPASTSTPYVVVNWTGQDDAGGSGIATYDVYLSEDASDFVLWREGTIDTSATYFGTPGHTYAFYSVATDNVGNQEAKTAYAEAITILDVDETPPTVTIDQALDQPDPTRTGPIHFTVVFSEPVLDFTAADVLLGGTAPGTLSAVVTSADAATHDVAVSGMTGSGTVIATIAAGVAHDTAGNPNLASTSTDNEVTYITAEATISGFVYFDGNNNGVKDPTDRGLRNVPITLSGTVTRTTTTGSDGSYTFDHLPAGTYTVTETQPMAFLDGRDTLGTPASGSAANDCFMDVTVSGNMQLTNYNFGERGLRPELINLEMFYVSTLATGQLLQELDLVDGNGWLQLQATSAAVLTAALPAGTPLTLELYASDWQPLAIGAGQWLLNARVEARTTYVLHVAAGNGANTALMAFNADLGIPFATFENGQFTNPNSPYDVNGDGQDTPLDVLQAINEVNLRGPHLLLGPHQDPPYFDVNHDEYLTALDVLHVINRLNQQALGGEAETNLAGLTAEGEASGWGVFSEDLAGGADRLWVPADKGRVMVAADRGTSVDWWTARTQESVVGTKSAPIAGRAVAKEADIFQDFDAWDAGLEPLLDELAIGLLTQRRL